MNGELAQAIALAAHGSAWLREPSGPAPGLESASTFDYVQSISFVLDGREIASSVSAWFDGLRGRAIDRVWLEIPDESTGGRWLADHLASAFAGGGRWQLRATAGSFAEVWRPGWSVDRDAPDGRIWQVTYAGERVRAARAPDSTASSESLADVLAAVRAFASQEVPDFVENFDLAVAALDGRDPGPPYYRDMLPPSYPQRSHALVAACAHAWVFGGMGSWNDVGFTDEALSRQHAELSRRLWHAITTTLVAAVNVDLGDQPPGTTTPAS